MDCARTERSSSKVCVVLNGREVDAKSILSVLGLGAGQGTEVTLIAEGEDEVQVIEAICQLVGNNFGEDD